MAIIFIDAVNGTFSDGALRYDSFQPHESGGGNTPWGTPAYQQTTDRDGWQKNFTPAAIGHAGCYRKSTSLNSDNNGSWSPLAFLGPTFTKHVVLTTTVLGEVRARLGAGNGTILATSVNLVIEINAWHYWEVWVSIDDVAGRVVVDIDGQNVIDFTGDTRNGGSDTQVGSILWGISPSVADSDIFIADDSTMRGPSIVSYHKTNGNGTNSGLMGSDSNQVDNFALVDDPPAGSPGHDTEATYVVGSIEGEKDTYAMEDVQFAGVWDVVAFAPNLIARDEGGGVQFVRPLLITDALEFQGTTVSLPASYAFRQQIYETNPDTTVAWTEAEIDAIEVGAEVRDS